MNAIAEVHPRCTLAQQDPKTPSVWNGFSVAVSFPEFDKLQ